MASCRDWEWKATGWMPWFGVVTERIAAMAWSEASVSSVIGRSGIQWQRIGAEVNASFRWLKQDFSVGLNRQGIDFRHRFVSGWVISE